MNIIKRILAWRLFSRDPTVSNPADIIKWWELRRVFYNVIVGITGIITLVILGVDEEIANHVLNDSVTMLPDPPLLGLIWIIAYGIAANVCYTGGWIAEVCVRKLWQDRAGAFGEIAFVIGLIFSVLVTILPAAIGSLILGMRLLRH